MDAVVKDIEEAVVSKPATLNIVAASPSEK